MTSKPRPFHASKSAPPVESRPDLREEQRRAYRRLAAEGPSDRGCGPGCGPGGLRVAGLPEEIAAQSLGSGDPVTLADIRPGDTVLDLGCGAGVDCLAAARRAGETGRVIGVDMTAEMLDRARENRDRLGLTNVELRLGEMERLPVDDGTIDVVLSNCVLNLSPDRPQVFREAFRVLRPGGQLVVSDVMLDAPLPDALLERLGEHADVLATMAVEKDYLTALEATGFVDVEIDRRDLSDPVPATSTGRGKGQARVVVQIAETGETLGEMDLSDLPPGAVARSFSATVRARKPGG